ncbi:sulfatase-like hydrolase/transferase [uncultured Draconibacterium sp.]|uniref:sulfatase-like hydrolase/transferase n=1 Tax=uncultured Draconibacterium sp. TaxID=1573823 RepID=UPI0032604C1B
MKLFKITILIIVVLAYSLTSFSQKPNIIFILTDDQGWNDLSVRSNKDLAGSKSDYHETPNTDKLALSGMRFSDAYAPFCVCSPSRHSIQFGISSTSLNNTDNFAYGEKRSNPTFSLVATIKKIDPSYKTGAYGKWNLPYYSNPGVLGYDDWHTGSPVDPHKKPPEQEGKKMKDGTIINDDPKHINRLTTAAINFMTEQVSNNTPFFCYIAHWAPHYPNVTTQAMYDKYDSKTKGSYHSHVGRAAMMENLDDGIGRVLDMVQDLGIEDNTYIIFTSDNGSGVRGWIDKYAQQANWGDPAPLFGGKATLYQGGLRVPFIISGPGIEPNSWNSAQIIGYDIFPTICDILGGIDKAPGVVEGASLKEHCLNGSSAELQRNEEIDGFPFVFNEPDDLDIWEKSAFVKGDYKILLQHEYNPDRYHLFNTKEDISEETNLISVMPDKFSFLLRQWYNHVVDKKVTLPANALNEALTYLSNHYERDISRKVEAEDYRNGYGIVAEINEETKDGFVANINAKDYMDFELDVEQAGYYDVSFRVSSANSEIGFDIKKGSTIVGSINETATGNLQTWKSTEKIGIVLEKGSQVLRLEGTGGTWNLDWMEFEEADISIVNVKELKKKNYENMIHIYPNPAVETSTTLWFDNEIINQTFNINIHNIQGKLMFSKTIRNEQMKLNVDSYMPGVYFVSITNNEFSITKKLLINFVQ